MRKILLALFVSVFALGLHSGDAEAARLGGGKSFGMQRQSLAPRPMAPSQHATPTPRPAPASAPAPAPKRNWAGPLAGLAAGLGIAALLSHFGMGEGMANILLLGLLLMAGVFLLKLLFRRSAPQPASTLHYAGASAGEAQTSPLPAAFPGNSAPHAPHLPDGFDSEAFLRVAKLNFVRLQAANDAKNLDDLREFVSPEIYAEIKLQMDERGNTAQQTDIVTLEAELLEVSTEAGRHIASVRFGGMIREQANAPALPFAEVWHLSKPTQGNKGWIICGIQQLQ